MSDTNPNTPPPVDEFRASVRTALGLPADADDATISGAIAGVSKERDEHKATIESERSARAAERVDSEIRNAFDRTQLDKRNLPDALALMRPLFTVDEGGRVVSKGGDTGEPSGLSPSDWVASRLPSLRSHWYPTSVGAGAKGGGFSHNTLGDTSAFDPRSPNYSVTRQFQLEVERGTRWADAARAKYRGQGGGR